LKKIAAEATQVSAVEKARLAEQEKARLAAEGARQVEQAKAAAAAKAAEDARIAAEKAKRIEQEKAAAAEKARQAEQEKVRLAAEKAKQAEQEKAAAAEQARIAAEEKKKQQLAAVSPADKPEQQAVDLPRALQGELRRVGCSTSTVDGNWNAASQKALDLFNKHAGMKLEVKTASTDALDAVKGKTSRVCPLICDTGFRADGDRCVKITCRAGFRVNDDNECEKVQDKKPVAKRDETKKPDRAERAKADAAPTKPQVSGQVICNSAGCRAVAKGCRLVVAGGAGTTIARYETEVCN
jgi:hypothetical protein